MSNTINNAGMTPAIEQAEVRSFSSKPQKSPDLRPESIAKPAAGLEPAGSDRGELNQAIVELNDRFAGLNTNLQFSIDDQAGRIVVKILDSKTDQVIRQIPSEKALALARHIRGLETAELSEAARYHGGGSLLGGLLIQVQT